MNRGFIHTYREKEIEREEMREFVVAFGCMYLQQE